MRITVRMVCAATLVSFSLAPGAVGAQTAARRAIVVSFDGFSEARLRQLTTAADAPAFWSLFSGGACAEAVRPSFPSVTPAGHAAIWTGAWGNVSGIAASQNGALPHASTTILESSAGFSAAALRAEPVWITAARSGRRVFAHFVTQAPGAPGYPSAGAPTRTDSIARERAAETLQGQRIAVTNGYNRLIEYAKVLTESNSTPLPARGWTNVPRQTPGSRPPLEISWKFGEDSLHALFTGSRSYTRVLVSASRDGGRGVTTVLAPADTSDPKARPLARYFSPALRIGLQDGAVTHVFARFWEAAPDLSRFILFVSEARVIDGNRPEIAREYDLNVGGVPGNGASRQLERGELGRITPDGGNGIAEWRYLETVELVTRQFMRGTAWGWRRYQPELMLDYFPYPDEALHQWLGYADPLTPGIQREVRAGIGRFLARSYRIADVRLAAILVMGRQSARTLTVVTGEHGMRPTWRLFQPNIVLRDAGLLVADTTGRVDLSRTYAVAPNSYWVTANRTSRKNGIVPADSVESVLARASAVLLAARDETGAPIVTQVWRSGPATDSLGIGGISGGDLYFEVAPGIHVGAGRRGAMLASETPGGEHGYPSTSRDMQPVMCAVGAAVRPHRFGMARSIDIAPTVAEWLRIPSPANATGRSRLRDIRADGPR